MNYIQQPQQAQGYYAPPQQQQPAQGYYQPPQPPSYQQGNYMPPQQQQLYMPPSQPAYQRGNYMPPQQQPQYGQGGGYVPPMQNPYHGAPPYHQPQTGVNTQLGSRFTTHQAEASINKPSGLHGRYADNAKYANAQQQQQNEPPVEEVPITVTPQNKFKPYVESGLMTDFSIENNIGKWVLIGELQPKEAMNIKKVPDALEQSDNVFNSAILSNSYFELKRKYLAEEELAKVNEETPPHAIYTNVITELKMISDSLSSFDVNEGVTLECDSVLDIASYLTSMIDNKAGYSKTDRILHAHLDMLFTKMLMDGIENNIAIGGHVDSFARDIGDLIELVSKLDYLKKTAFNTLLDNIKNEIQSMVVEDVEENGIVRVNITNVMMYIANAKIVSDIKANEKLNTDNAPLAIREDSAPVLYKALSDVKANKITLVTDANSYVAYKNFITKQYILHKL